MSATLVRRAAATFQWSRGCDSQRWYARRSSELGSNASEKAKLAAGLKRLVQHHRNFRGALDGDGYEDDALTTAKREWRWIVDEAQERARASATALSFRSQREYVAESVLQMVRRLTDEGEPMAYVLGHQPFGPLRIECSAPTLIPRSETEALTEHVAEHIVRSSDAQTSLRILDLCTGTGCMSLLIRHRLLQHFASQQGNAVATLSASITAVDIASEAIALTNRNAALYECSNLCADASMKDACQRLVTIDTRKANMMDDVAMQELVRRDGPFDVLICNPPYIPLHEWKTLDRSVRDWEDRRALVGDVKHVGDGVGGDGLGFYHRLAHLIRVHNLLRHPSHFGRESDSSFPIVAVEVGYNQAPQVVSILTGAGLQNIHIWKDQYGVDRAVLSLVER